MARPEVGGLTGREVWGTYKNRAELAQGKTLVEVGELRILLISSSATAPHRKTPKALWRSPGSPGIPR